MKTEDHIPRLLSDPDGLDFDGLRRKGVALLQALTSGRWTDYNLHDPGVTLLELLCYGLTDLVYRTDFEVADLLTDASGAIDFHGQALFPPNHIFPNQPVTDVDFCKLIYDRLPDVDDVWLRPAADALPGLFSVYVLPRASPFSGAAQSEPLRQQVTQLLARHRNLCRDVAQVCIVRAERYTLGGEVEIDDSRPAADVQAEIYFRCAKLISSGGQMVRFEDALAQGKTWEQLLDGPRTDHGYVDDAHFSEANHEIDVVQLIRRVCRIPGVKRVIQLYLRDPAGKVVTVARVVGAGEVSPVLGFPEQPAETQALRLTHGKSAEAHEHEVRDDTPRQPGRDAQQFHEQVTLYLRKLEFEHDAFRRNDGQLERLVQLPQGRYRDVAQYSSVGEHTPAIYGINHFGVPSSEPDEVHARARQLKAYLYPFEQMMANYLASLQGLKTLYSTDSGLDKSYRAQFLRDSEVPHLEVLYDEGVTPGRVEALLAAQDPFAGRRNRVLDSLLAVYGEVFEDDALRRYDVYHTENFELHLIACKISLLRHLCTLSASRGQAMQAPAPYWLGANYAAIQLRVQLLAGASEQAVGRSLIEAVHNDEVRFFSDLRYRQGLEKQAGYPPDVAYEATRLLAWTGGPAPGGMADLPLGAVCASLLRAGIRWENYCVLPVDAQQGWLCLRLDDARCWPLVLLPAGDVEAAAVQLRSRLIELNRACEGFHLLEHLLLRPRGAHARHDAGEDFYGHRVSIMLPAFTARLVAPKCRAWLEELIARNLPAHILPDFYWLDFAFLAQFEQRYRRWLERLNAVTGGSEDVDGLDVAADRLIELLGKLAPYKSKRIWV